MIGAACGSDSTDRKIQLLTITSTLKIRKRNVNTKTKSRILAFPMNFLIDRQGSEIARYFMAQIAAVAFADVIHLPSAFI